MHENTELSELQRRLHAAHESSARLRDTITRLESQKVMLVKLAAENVCMFCAGRVSAYKQVPDGPNEHGKWTHQYTPTMRTEDRVVCDASAIFARILDTKAEMKHENPN